MGVRTQRILLGSNAMQPTAPAARCSQRRGRRLIADKFSLAYKPARNVPIEKGVLIRGSRTPWEENVNGLIYLIGLIVVILFILSFLGLR